MDTKSSDLVGQRQLRIDKLKSLRELGIDPYPAKSVKTHANAQIAADFANLENQEVTLTGRLDSWRTHGKLVFADLVDSSGKIQLYIKEDTITEDLDNGHLGWDKLELVDLADFVEATGTVVKTQRGEISLLVKHLRIIAKTLRPLPTELESKEQQFRRRYLDLNLHPEKRELFMRKAKFWRTTREFLHSRGFVEVETPVLEHKTGGADARPFVTHHNDLDQDFYLRISTELFQKRLVGAGFEKIFTLAPNFRNEGLSDEHLQEYYACEWYWAYADYNDTMKLVQDLITHVAQEVYGTTKFSTRGHEFDLAHEWQQIDYVQVIKDKHGVDIFTTPDEEMLAILQKEGVDLSGGEFSRNRLIDNLWKLIRKTISGPAFLINEPKFMSPLAKSKADNPELTERIHLILGGSELGNGYSEINDPQDQLDRFLDQQKMRVAGDDEAQMLDIDFVEMLEYGMPPTSGWGHSERVFWFFENVTAREGTLFPQLKEEVEGTTKKIYADILDFILPQKTMMKSSTAADVTGLPTREEALKILTDHVKDDYQVLHSKMVATAMEEYATKLGENADLWYLTGLLHDLDYFEHPEKHPGESLNWFKTWGYPEELIHAVEAHAINYNGFNTEPQTKLAAALIACDEMSGLLYAYSLMRPTGFTGMEVSSVKKKYKDKAFAAKINRGDIEYGMQKLEVEFADHVATLLGAFAKMDELKK